MKGAPRSTQFDDIYFSAEDGLAEAQHVFLSGNNLPAAWAEKKQFTIGETGFGTGLNFLAVWEMFEKTASANQMLDFVSFEKYPLRPSDICAYLSPWAEHFGDKIALLCKTYPLRIAGFHRLKLTPQITLTLIFDDINTAIPQLDGRIDAWFLDGFTPAKNPDMWSDTVFQHMARLSHAATSYATFTAAGFVRRGLSDAGFTVEKKSGFGSKRDMITGRFDGIEQGIESGQRLPLPQRIAIIGGGLAGTACAYTLAQYGFSPTIYERSNTLAAGASGNRMGFYNPRFTAQRDAVSDFFAPAFNQFYQTAKNMDEAPDFDPCDFDPCGALHLINAPEKERRFHKLIEHWGWHEDHVSLLDQAQASHVAGINLPSGALYLPQSGGISPHKLCHAYAKNIETHLNTTITDIESIDADAVILCNGSAVADIAPQSWLTLETVRGQVTEITQTPASQHIRCNIHYGGYLSKAYDGHHMVGATFQRWLDHEESMDEDNIQNIRNMKDAIPALSAEEFDITACRASLRTATKDRFPLITQLADRAIYTATAFGSHGLIGSIMAAHYMADLLRGAPVLCLPRASQYALSAQRFIDRENKKK